jgi:hypothetical protein
MNHPTNDTTRRTPEPPIGATDCVILL